MDKIDRELKFAVDSMLGKLAKWLRIMGYDVIYSPMIEDDYLMWLSSIEGRIVITRDTKFFKKIGSKNSFFVRSDKLKEQVFEVIKGFDLNPEDNMLSRCVNCNTRLTQLPKEEASGLVPEYIFLNHEEFYYCENCKKVYWDGTHTANMKKMIDSFVSN